MEIIIIKKPKQKLNKNGFGFKRPGLKNGVDNGMF